MELSPDPVPYRDAMIEGIPSPVSKGWGRWFDKLLSLVAASARVVTALAFDNPTLVASLPPTSLGVTQAGIYAVSWVLRVTQQATTSSSLSVSVSYLDNGVAVTQTGPVLANGTVTSVQSGTFTVQLDAASPLVVSTTYASVGATPMRYKLAVQCLRVT